MKNYVTFNNAGELDRRLFTSFGVSVKDNADSAIGYFGTGLKYAIAIILREGGEIAITSGKEVHIFSYKNETIRGKDFNFVHCNDQGLPFTLELGKNWQLWMAYRELYSNMQDEEGFCSIENEIEGKDNLTKVFVSCPGFYDIHLDRDSIFLNKNRTPFYEDPEVEIYEGASKCVFCKGVRVYDRAGLFTYNFKRAELTEDRTLKYAFSLDMDLGSALSRIKDKRMIHYLIENQKKGNEKYFTYSSSSNNPSEEFLEGLTNAYANKSELLTGSQIRLLNFHQKDNLTYVPMTTKEGHRIARVLAFLSRIGFECSYPIRLVETLGASALAMARMEEKEIIISRRLFDQGTKQLASALLEETIHLRENLKDETRGLQTYLFDKIITLGEEITGEQF